MKRIIAAACALICCIMLMACAQAETAADVPYPVETLSLALEFPAKPQISVNNALVGEYTCRLADYELRRGKSICALLSLTFTDELRGALEGMSFEDRASMLRMCMALLEDRGLVVALNQYISLYGDVCLTFGAYGEEGTFIGWAALNPSQLSIVMASPDSDGYAFLGSVYSHAQLSFNKDGRTLSHGSVYIEPPFAMEAEGGSAECTNSVTHLTAELIQLPDLALIGAEGGDMGYDMLARHIPSGAADITQSSIGGAAAMDYTYEGAQTGAPMQGRLIMAGDCILRMEATIDNAGDAYMDSVYFYVSPQ